MKDKKQEIIKKVLSIAKEYKENMTNNKFLVIYYDKEHDEIGYAEIIFLASNFQHLTGVRLKGYENKKGEGSRFYKLCISNDLSVDDIYIPNEDYTFKKLNVLPYIVKFEKSTNICGEYNYGGFDLKVDFIFGSVKYTLGASKGDDNHYYYPSSCINEDSRMYIRRPMFRVLMIYKKYKTEEIYVNEVYRAKNIEESLLNKVKDNKDIKSFINWN